MARQRRFSAQQKPRSLLKEKAAKLEYRLLTEFRRLFEGKIHKHRDSSQGDFIAMHLYEDLITINRSPKLVDAAINRKDRVLKVQNAYSDDADHTFRFDGDHDSE